MVRASYGTGSVTRARTPGRWRLRWSAGIDPFTGRTVTVNETVSAPSRTAARRILTERTAHRADQSRITVGDLLTHTLDQLPVQEVTRNAYRSALKHVPAPVLAWVANDVTIVQARDIITGLSERANPPTVHKAHAALMACWKQGRLNGWLGAENPWRGQRLPKLAGSAGQVLTDDEVISLRAVASPLERIWLDVHLATGARPGEVLRLRWSDINLEDCTISFIDTKHRGALRVVAITDTLTADLAALMATEHAVYAEADPFLFPWTAWQSGHQRWHALRARAGIRPTLRLYDLRHTHNSWLDAAGIDATTRAARIGNSPATNSRIYSHPLSDRAAADAVAGRLT